MARQNLPFSPKKHCMNALMVIPLQMDILSPILPYYGSQQRSFFLPSCYSTRSGHYMENKRFHKKKKKNSTFCSITSETHLQWLERCRKGSALCYALYNVLIRGLLWSTLWQVFTSVHLASIRMEEDGSIRRLYFCKTKLSAPSLKPSGFAR